MNPNFNKLNDKAKYTERLVISWMIQEQQYIDVPVEYFYNTKIRQAYSRLKQQYTETGEIEPDTWIDMIKLTEHAQDIATPAKINPVVKELHKHYIARQAYIEIQRAVDRYPDNPDQVRELIERVNNNTTQLLMGEKTEYVHPVSVNNLIKDTAEKAKSGNKLRGVSTKIPVYDFCTSGFIRGQTYLIKAKEKAGKSRKAVCLTDELLTAEIGGIWFSMEMSEQKLNTCYLARRTGITTDKFGTAKMSEDNIKSLWQEASARYMQEPIYIDTTSAVTLSHIRATIQQQKIKMQNAGSVCGWAVVDYAQRAVSGDMVKEIEAFAKGLADIGRDESVIIIVLSQINKEGGTMWGRALDQAADVIFAMWEDKDRPETVSANAPATKHLKVHIKGREVIHELTTDIDAQLGLCNFYEVDNIHEDF